MAKPASTEEAAALVKLCAQHGVAICPQGGNTGLVDAGVPHGEICVSMRRMNKVRSVDVFNNSMVVEAGAPLVTAQATADEVNRLFPLSLGSEGTATIGGLISTNAGGVAVLRYGMMRDLILGLEVVLPSGEVWDGLSGLRKNNTGYDLKHLFAYAGPDHGGDAEDVPESATRHGLGHGRIHGGRHRASGTCARDCRGYCHQFRDDPGQCRRHGAGRY